MLISRWWRRQKFITQNCQKDFINFYFLFKLPSSLSGKNISTSQFYPSHTIVFTMSMTTMRHYQKIDWVWSQQGRKKTNNETNSYKCKINALFRRKRKFISKKYHEFVYITRNLLSFIKINIIFNEKCPKFCIETIFYN